MDIVPSAARSAIMARVPSKGSRPERLVRSELHRRGFRFQLHRKDLPGKPDIVLPGRRVAIFVHGCFWHAHKYCNAAKVPSSNREYWTPKLEGNVQRDTKVQQQLGEMGWEVRVIWSCELGRRSRREATINDLVLWLNDRAKAARPVS